MPTISHRTDPTRDAQKVCRLQDGPRVQLRPIRPGDALRERDFLAHLSPEYRAYRFLGLVKPPSAQVAEELTHPDADEVVLAALVESAGQMREIGRQNQTPVGARSPANAGNTRWH